MHGVFESGGEWIGEIGEVGVSLRGWGYHYGQLLKLQGSLPFVQQVMSGGP